jgi:translation initiation factor 2 subunit 2
MEYSELLKRALSKVHVSTSEDRFKIPSVDSNISGKQTLIRNFGEIANMLRRDPKHLAKFLFKDLAIPGTIDDNKLLLQRNFDRDKIDKSIKLYCTEYLYCRECGKADTKLLKKDNVTVMKCEACGAERSVKKL